ncbi:MAG: ATP-binding protein [Candidatus Sulfotelmatobacter sp.]|jgi:hypothetical protein
MRKDFYNIGPKKSDIEVRISYRIIQLFSEGLYSSPNKAIEELVSNSFDAGATNVHVILPADLTDRDGTIVVLDDGIGMDAKGLGEHWLIGVSRKRDLTKLPKGRKQIGKFGIGKLATYVLSNRLTHICKIGGVYYSTSMDYSKIPSGEGGAVREEKVLLPLRKLTEQEAKEAVGSLVAGTKPGYKAVKLFGPGAAKTWTVAVMSDLKDMASEIQRGRLRWILQTAMPLRDDFALFLNGEKVPPSKLTAKKVGHWILGKDLTEIPKPAPDDLEVIEEPKALKKHRYGLNHPELGRITGYAEVYEDPLDTGKSTGIERSNGFFVYVRERLVNEDDPGFGINRNLLRHGTFSRFRMVVHIDKLDEELRSSRETLRVGPLVTIAQNLLHAVFNYARVALEKHETEQSTAERISSRITGAPGSLTRRPIIGLVQSAFSGQAHPKYISYPEGLDQPEKESFLASLEQRAETEEFVRDVQLVEMSQDQGIAVLNVETGVLQINTLHPFVAHFLDEYENKKRSLPLELLAMSEVLLEAHLYESGLNDDKVDDLLSRRDEALRYLARSTGKRNARLIAQDLLDASTDKDALEKALVTAFDSMGFDAVPLGGSGKPDGLAAARLAGDARGKPHRYSVSLEAKSKEQEGRKVSAKTVGVSTIARQRDDYNCDHAIVAGPDFPTTEGEKSALVKEIASDRTASGKTITLIRLTDLAKLVRLVPLKRVGLTRIQELFDSCTTPEESKAWVEKLAAESVAKVPYKLILEAIWDLQDKRPNEAVEYSGLAVSLQSGSKPLNIAKVELIEICKAMSRVAPEMLAARTNSVELSQRPDKVLALIGAVFGEYPEDETKGIQI